MNDNPQVLVVDDDAGIRDLLADYLLKQGLAVATARDGKEMDERLTTFQPDIIVMDLMMPGEDGLALTRRVKAVREVPVIILSARGEDIDRIVGLEVGADDYLAKPFNPRELLARIRAVLRRQPVQVPATQEDAKAPLQAFGPYVLDAKRRELTRDGVPLALTSSEFDLLQVFVARPNRLLNRDSLLDLLKGYERSPFDRSMDVQVARLRAKIEPDTKHPIYIRTVWGKGYVFTPQGEP